MSAFDDELKTMFAQGQEPGDDGFTRAFIERLGARERVQTILTQATYAGYAFTMLAVVFVCFSVIGRIAPHAPFKGAALASLFAQPAFVALAAAPVLVAAAIAFAALSYVRARE